MGKIDTSKCEFSLEWLDHDNWNGGIDTYKLVFYLKYSDYTKIIDLKKLYEDAIMNSIDSFYKDERNIIACVEIATKIDQFVDWAAIAADFQSVGMYGRELLITLAQTVFDKEKHPSPDGTDIGKADSKRMLEAYIHYCLHKRSKEREIKFAKSSIDFSNELTHNRTATQMDAELCYNAVLSTVHIIKVLNKFND